MSDAVNPSYASDSVENGYNDRAVNRASAEVGVQIADLVQKVAEVFSDNNPNNDREGYAALAAISAKASQLSHVNWTAADGNTTLAKKIAKQMVGGSK